VGGSHRDFNPTNLIFGFVLGYGALFVARRALGPTDYFLKVWRAISFALFFLWELIIANLRVARDVLTAQDYMKPRVIAIPLDARTDAEITALAYVISLTPGTLSLDVSTDAACSSSTPCMPRRGRGQARDQAGIRTASAGTDARLEIIER
jgi:multicomponent Na+:H+ antiporter subunit E